MCDAAHIISPGGEKERQIYFALVIAETLLEEQQLRQLIVPRRYARFHWSELHYDN